MFGTNKIYKIDRNGNRKRILGIIPGLWIAFRGKNSVVEIKEPFPKFCKCKIRLKNNSFVSIGSLGRIKKLNIIGESNQSYKIGNNFQSLSCELTAANEKNLSIQIGDDCLFSKNIILRASDGHAIIDKETKKILNYGKDIIIGNHVWIAGNVTILKGVNIGNNCVIGHGSIVTKECFENSLYVGVPAKLVKKNISWSGHITNN